jgi:hypothetical protein
VFIEMSLPDETTNPTAEPWWLQAAFDGLREEEREASKQSRTIPAAYVIVANHPYHHHLDGTAFRVGLVAEGLGSCDFHGDWRGSIRDALRLREKHRGFLALWRSIEKHRVIPTTFDATNPHLAYGDQAPRLQIGARYLVPTQEGDQVEGLLVDAVAVPSERKVFGVYSLRDGRQIICVSEMTESEVQAHLAHPETFFGVEKDAGKPLTDPLDLFDFLFTSYKDTPRDRLLEFCADAPDIEELRGLAQSELAITYCERLTYETMRRSVTTKAPRSARGT